MSLENLCNISSPCGEEKKIKEFLISELKEYTDSYFEDNFGNLVFNKKGSGEKICFECGTDEPFLSVSAAEEDKTRFMAPPQISVKGLIGREMLSEGGKAFLLKSEKEPNESRISQLYAEISDLPLFEKCTLKQCYSETREEISAFNLRYKAPAFVMCEAVKSINKSDKDLYFAFTAQKCLGARGEKAMLEKYAFDEVISVLCVEKDKYFSPGCGAVIMAKDKRTPASVSVKNKLISAAKAEILDYKVGLSGENLYLSLPQIMGECALSGCVGLVFDNNSINRDKILKKDIENITKLINSYCK